MRGSYAAAAVGLILFGGLAGWTVAHERISPGVRVAGVYVGGRTVDEARGLIAAEGPSFARAPVVVTDGDAVWPTTNAAIGVTLDTDAAARLAVAIGRSGSPADRARDVIEAANGGRDLGWPRRSTDAKLEAFVQRVAGEVERPPIDGDVVVDSDGVRISPSVAGAHVDRALLRADILAARAEVAIVALGVEPLEPSIGQAQVSALAAQANAAYAPLRLSAGGESMTVDAPSVGALLRTVHEGVAGAERLRLDVDRSALAALVDRVAAALDGDARDAALAPGEAQLVVSPGRDGVIIDRPAAADALAAAILGGQHAVALPATVSHPSLSTANATQIASTTRLVGGFTTYFPVNEARRINISRAAAAFDGMSIGPGETFSFWDRIGEVSTRTGYVYAGAIIGGVSSTAIGGGLCQVSTTLFNAVAAAGYAIDERHPHAYYIERYPMGLDAAVFAPDTDLIWTNDTSSAAIIRAAASETSVSFWIYSVPTGRVTTFSEAQEWNFRWPYAGQPADPAHAPGYVVLGREVLVTRTVIEPGGDVVHRDEFYSHYAPVWGGPAR